MSDDLSHLLAPHRATARLDDDERIAQIHEERWIHYTRAERILQRLEALINYPQRGRMPCLVLYGVTGMGKTCVVDRFVSDHPSSRDTPYGPAEQPVVLIQMPPTPSERHLYEEMLSEMNGLFADRTGVSPLRHQIRLVARQLQVRMLIIDEIHSILAGTFREQRVILNAIRFLANDLQIPIVCVGTHEASRALMTDQQLADRFEAAELPKWKDDAAFQQLLLSFESILPLRSPSEFRDPRVRSRILSLTEGVLVRICRLLEAAAAEAIRSHRERIDLTLLKGSLITESLVSIADRRSRRASAR